jgi:hypothetical protein
VVQLHFFGLGNHTLLPKSPASFGNRAGQLRLESGVDFRAFLKTCQQFIAVLTGPDPFSE